MHSVSASFTFGWIICARFSTCLAVAFGSPRGCHTLFDQSSLLTATGKKNGKALLGGGKPSVPHRQAAPQKRLPAPIRLVSMPIKCIGLDWVWSSNDDAACQPNQPHGQWHSTPWVSYDSQLASSSLDPPWRICNLRHRQYAHLQASSLQQAPMPMTGWQVSVALIVLYS